MAYRYHPEIEGLKVNEDGSEVILNGQAQHIWTFDRPGGQKKIQVNMIGREFSVRRLVCECWNGMPENPRWTASKKDRFGGLHYSNLHWKPRGFYADRKKKNDQ